MLRRRLAIAGVLLIAGALCPGAFAAEESGASARDAQAPAAPRLDVVFMIDTTGSMGDEIQVVKDTVREMVAKIASGKPTPQARFGLVLYRDRGDQYVTKMTKLTYEIDELVEAIKAIEAGGGGDYPESLVEALHVAVSKMNWDADENVEKTLFVICDAPPHLDYDDDFDYEKEIAKALDLGIIVHVIGCSGLAAKDAEFLEKKIAKAAEGTYNPLTYKRTYVDAEGRKSAVLEAGGRMYELGAAPGVGMAAGADWRKGADRLAAAGAAAEAAPAGMGGMGGGAMTLAAAPMAGPAGPRGDKGDKGDRRRARPVSLVSRQVGATENNLDTILVRVVQRQAEARGVKYADTGRLEMLARFEGVNAAHGLAGQRVLRQASEWDALWRGMHARMTPLPETPKIDFAENMALAVFAGEKRTGGHQVHIASVTKDDDGLEAQVWTKEPPEGAMTTMALTYPYSIVVVPREDGPVRWVRIAPPADK